MYVPTSRYTAIGYFGPSLVVVPTGGHYYYYYGHTSVAYNSGALIGWIIGSTLFICCILILIICIVRKCANQEEDIETGHTIEVID